LGGFGKPVANFANRRVQVNEIQNAGPKLDSNLPSPVTSESRSQIRVVPMRCRWQTIESSVQVAWSCVSNAFELHPGMEFIRIAVFGQILGNILQHRCIRRVNQCSKLGIRLVPRLCPEPKSGQQNRSPFNEGVGRIRDEMFGGVRRRPLDLRPNVLLRLFFELNESAHVSAVWHWIVPRGLSPRLIHQIPVMLSPA